MWREGDVVGAEAIRQAGSVLPLPANNVVEAARF